MCVGTYNGFFIVGIIKNERMFLVWFSIYNLIIIHTYYYNIIYERKNYCIREYI